MSASIESIKALSPESQKIADAIRAAMMDRTNPAVKPAKLDDYLLFCEEALNMVPGEMLTEDMVLKIMENLTSRTRFKDIFPSNHKCIIAIIPTDRYGNTITGSDIETARYIVKLLVEPEPPNREARTVGGFTGDASYIQKVLPVEFTEYCSFDIGAHKEVDDEFAAYDMDEDVRKLILSRFRKALENARLISNREMRFLTPAKEINA